MFENPVGIGRSLIIKSNITLLRQWLIFRQLLSRDIVYDIATKFSNAIHL